MIKKILLSAMVVVGVGATVLAATNAFFSDTETSTGNTFTAGKLDLKVDSKCTYNGLTSSQCGTWELKDLIPTSDKFFNFTDVKPGDYGENTISLHVDNNDAYMCLVIDNMHNDDNGLTEPESVLDTTGGLDQGELADSIHFFAWADDGDNVWEVNEPKLFSNTEGPASDVLGGVAYPLYTPQTSVFPGGQTKYTGVYWCYGTLTANEEDHTLSCNGSTETNITQSDSLTADLSFYVEQSRNNPDFKCPDLRPTNGPISWINAVGAINDQAATSKEWYMRQVGNPAPAGYSHAYQWGMPSLTCDPNNTPVTFTGTIDVNSMVTGNVAFVGLVDKGLLANGKTGYQSGAYLYVFKNSATTVRIGPTDGNLGGEIVQVFTDYAVGDGILDIVMTISAQNISLSIDGNPAMQDSYGDVKVLNNDVANGLYAWNEFANGAVPGWDNFQSNTMPYNLSLTGCN